MRKIAVLFTALALVVTAAHAGGSSLEQEITAFKKKIMLNFQNERAYENFVDALEREKVIGDMKRFQEVMARALVPQQMKGKLINRDGMEAYHRLGLVLYGRGHEDESMHLFEEYKKTRKYTPEEGLKKARSEYEQATGEEPPH